MGRNYCKSKRKNFNRFEDKVLFCFHGDTWEGSIYESGFRLSNMEEIREFYNLCKDAIYSQWRDGGHAGSRPWCWRQFEYDKDKNPLKILASGVSEYSHWNNETKTKEYNVPWEKKEPELNYLMRLGLLETWEDIELEHCYKIGYYKRTNPEAVYNWGMDLHKALGEYLISKGFSLEGTTSKTSINENEEF